MIQIRHLRKSYDDLVALTNISLTLKNGSFVTFIGSSGCGKSTLLHLLAGLEKPTSGSIALSGKTIQPTDVALVFQKANLLPWKTVLENVQLPLLLRPGRKQKDPKAMLQLVGLDDFADSYPYQLSGGMQQRVSIARALVADPKILLMDEPFSSVDEIERERLQEILLDIWKKEKKTILFVTHSIAEAAFLSDRVITFTHRPGSIKHDLTLSLPRPRTPDVRTSKDYLNTLQALQRSLA